MGLTQGCANLAVVLLPEVKEHARALQLLETACKDRNAHACLRLGDALYEDPREWNRAKISYENACRLQETEGCVSVGWMVLRGEGTRASADNAADWFRAPCEHDVFVACTGLGLALLDSATSERQAEQATHWLQVACAHDDAFGCFMAARRAAFEAHALSPDARTLFAKACRLGTKAACSVTDVPEKADDDRDHEPAAQK